MTDRVGQLLDDILAGPASLDRLLAAYDAPWIAAGAGPAGTAGSIPVRLHRSG